MQEKLLIIEDSPSISKIQKHIGVQCGYEVDVAYSLQEAIDFYTANVTSYFAAVVDFALPDAHRGQAIDFSIGAGIPTIAMTGMLSPKIRDEILSRPVLDYIPKENRQAFDYLKRLLMQLRQNQHIKVMVVDDSKVQRRFVADLLKRHYFMVIGAENGVDALSKLAKYPDIKIVITDQEMPKMDGVHLTNKIRQDYEAEDMVIIGISGAEDSSLSARFIKNGANDYLRKPFCPEEFYCRVFQNITYLNNIETIRKQANTDYLTELPNRRYFFFSAEKAMTSKQQANENCCLAIMDIDHFKSVNDTYGHDAGDEVLRQTAQLLTEHFGEDNLARFGGEEFCILFEDTDVDSIKNRLETFREAIEQLSVHYNDETICFTMSIGLAIGAKSELDTLINESDKCLYQAKEGGRNQLVSTEVE